MNKAIETCLTEQAHIKGMLCTDENGLLISARGDLEGVDEGRVHGIARKAAALHKTESPPVVVIEGEKANLVIKTYDQISIGVKYDANG